MTKTVKLDRYEIRFSGTGGQGIITLGRVMGSGLALGHGFNVTQTQSYGPEARGGSSRCDLVISTEAISYPKAESLDMLVALSPEACNAYYRYLKPGGILLVESDLVTQPPTNTYLGLPFTDLAKKKVGIVQAMNTVVLGALTYLMPFADQRLMRTSLKQSLPPKIQEVNVKAFNLGYREAKRVFGADGVNWTGKAEEVDGHEDI